MKNKILLLVLFGLFFGAKMNAQQVCIHICDVNCPKGLGVYMQWGCDLIRCPGGDGCGGFIGGPMDSIGHINGNGYYCFPVSSQYSPSNPCFNYTIELRNNCATGNDPFRFDFLLAQTAVLGDWIITPYGDTGKITQVLTPVGGGDIFTITFTDDLLHDCNNIDPGVEFNGSN